MRKQKSSNEVLVESGKVFTIFAAAGAKAVSGAVISDLNVQAPASREMIDADPTATESIDSPQELPETNFQDSGDFELDLSEMDNPDSEDWVVGATLTENLTDISKFDSQDSLENSGRGPGEFEVQGLGFDTVAEIGHEKTESKHPQENSSSEPDINVLDDEMAVQEIEPYAKKNEIEFAVEKNDSPPLKDENIDSPSPEPTETAQNEGLELSESSPPDSDRDQGLELDAPADDAGEISLETELELEKKDSKFDLDEEDTDTGETPESSIDLKDVPLELDPMLELENLDLDLEIENPEAESVQKDASQTPEEDENKPLLPEDNSKQD